MIRGNWIAGVVLACIAIFAIFMIAMAAAHEWYPYYCCMGNSVGGDCGPLDAKRVQALDAGGYLIDGRFYVAPATVQQSLDGRYHGCFPAGQLGCFFAPGRGS